MANLAATWYIARATLRRKGLSLLAFAGGVACFQALVAVSFPAIGGMEAVTSVVETFPEGLRNLLKLAPNLQAGFGLRDYLAFTWIHPVFLGLCAAFVVSRAADGLAGEIERGSVYLLLSRPVARWALVLGKAAEMMLGAGVLALAGWLGLVLGVWLAGLGPLPLERYALVALLAWLLFTALGGSALVISSVSSRADTAAGLGTAFTLVAFVLDVIPAVANSPVAWLNPWHHYFPQQVAAGNAAEPLGVVVPLLWAVVSVALAALLFGRRDLA